jgi:hypothetical protein
MYGLWVQTGAIFVSALSVIVTLNVQGRIARRRATLDLLLLETTSLALTEQRRLFLELRDRGRLEQWADKAKVSSEEASLIRSILNTYEPVAIGIDQKTIDPAIYKRWYRTSTVRDWLSLKTFAHAYQQNFNPKLFCEFEKLAKKWANADERKHV